MGSSRLRAAVLWTGGKDCALALQEVRKKVDVVCLTTFVPEKAIFKAHPLSLMNKQAAALGIRHSKYRVAPPYRKGYANALKRLRSRYSIDVLVTGDIDQVAGQPNWIRSCAEPLGFKVLTPLWGRDRKALLERFWRAGFEAVISFVNPPLGREFIGRKLDRECVRELGRIPGVDLCGENGEYHTMIVSGPGFKSGIKIPFPVSR